MTPPRSASGASPQGAPPVGRQSRTPAPAGEEGAHPYWRSLRVVPFPLAGDGACGLAEPVPRPLPENSPGSLVLLDVYKNKTAFAGRFFRFGSVLSSAAA